MWQMETLRSQMKSLGETQQSVPVLHDCPRRVSQLVQTPPTHMLFSQHDGPPSLQFAPSGKPHDPELHSAVGAWHPHALPVHPPAPPGPIAELSGAPPDVCLLSPHAHHIVPSTSARAARRLVPLHAFMTTSIVCVTLLPVSGKLAARRPPAFLCVCITKHAVAADGHIGPHDIIAISEPCRQFWPPQSVDVWHTINGR
jgi:hypothetical protein